MPFPVAHRLRGRSVAIGLLVWDVMLSGALAMGSPARAEAANPVQLLVLTDAAGSPTAVATAGLDDGAPTSTSGGSAVTPGLAARLSALAAPSRTSAIDPADDATLLTDPLEVDTFLVAGFSWEDADALPEGTDIYLRVRENGAWSDWYRSEEDGSGRDDGVGLLGTAAFVSGGADAVQVRVTGDATELPPGLQLALIPHHPDGEEQLDPDALPVTDAEDTPVVDDGSSPEPTAEATVDPTPEQPADTATGDATQETQESATAATGAASGTSGGGAGVNPALILPAATTANGLPVPVVTRSEWGANSAYLDWDPTYVTAYHAVVHHTVGTNSYSMSQSASIVAGIYYYHAVTLGWGDIGYNFLVDKYGQVFEGRYGTVGSPSGKMVVAAHARGANTGSMGISMMGTYTSTSPSSAQLTSVGRLAGWLLARGGVANAHGSWSFTIRTSNGMYAAGQVINLPYVSGHRDVYPTACPGNAAYAQLGSIQAIAQEQIGNTGTWVQQGGQWHYRTPGGDMATGWVKAQGKWYYLQPGSGAMATGWISLGGIWYYLLPDGSMATGWGNIAGTWYYFRPGDGGMATGWVEVAGTWYYMRPGGAMATGWVNLGGTWYYMRASGAMVSGDAWVDGVWSRFSAGGAWIGYR